MADYTVYRDGENTAKNDIHIRNINQAFENRKCATLQNRNYQGAIRICIPSIVLDEPVKLEGSRLAIE